MIEDIEELPLTLKKLDVLSIGNNKIKSLDILVQHLRKFNKLQVLNVAGCPFTENKDSDWEKTLIV